MTAGPDLSSAFVLAAAHENLILEPVFCYACGSCAVGMHSWHCCAPAFSQWPWTFCFVF